MPSDEELRQELLAKVLADGVKASAPKLKKITDTEVTYNFSGGSRIVERLERFWINYLYELHGTFMIIKEIEFDEYNRVKQGNMDILSLIEKYPYREGDEIISKKIENDWYHKGIWDL